MCVYMHIMCARVHDAVEEEECVMVKILKKVESPTSALQRLCLALVEDEGLLLSTQRSKGVTLLQLSQCVWYLVTWESEFC